MHDTHINIHRQPLHVFCDAKLRSVRSSSALGLWLINSRYRSRYLYLQRNTFWGRMVQYKWNLTAWTLKADTRCYRFLWNVYDIKKQKKRLIPSFSTLCIQLEVRKLNGGVEQDKNIVIFFTSSGRGWVCVLAQSRGGHDLWSLHCHPHQPRHTLLVQWGTHQHPWLHPGSYTGCLRASGHKQALKYS